MNLNIKTLFFLITNITLVIASCVLGTTITTSSSIINALYSSRIIEFVYFLLMFNVGLGIFGFVILQNLNDFHMNRLLSPDTIYLKLRIVSANI
jgi:hypothetical protein